ncbi:MAG: hypothetical protein RLY40_505 [Pseudomonadota bacterium]|jgi:hypothetical protein
MSHPLFFDTLQYVKKLKEAGVAENVAEIQAEAFKEVMENNLATKQDVKDLRQDMLIMKKDLTHDIETVSRNVELVKKDLTIRMGSMLAIAVSILSVLITLLNRAH